MFPLTLPDDSLTAELMFETLFSFGTAYLSILVPFALGLWLFRNSVSFFMGARLK